MDEIFGQEATTPVATEAAVNAEKERKTALKNAFKETMMENPEFSSKLHTLSNSIKLVNTLGFGTGGNIVVDKKASTNGNRVLKQTPAICGYKLQNIGDQVIEYTTEIFSQDETGKFVGQVVKKQWNPGETIDLTRQYTTMLCAIPEISFTLANGKIIPSQKKKPKSLKEELSSYFFTFNKAEDGTTIQVNDDEVKLSVSDADGKVKPEYVETFGYLNNPKESRSARTRGPKYTSQDLYANYIHKLVQDQGV